jgi:mRNA-degrading endonuclease RelE of RelBE toxin-antitoxin system
LPYRIDVSDEAQQHLRGLPAAQRALVVDQLNTQLTHQAIVVTRNRKPLRPNLLAGWELRQGELRVYYDVLAEPEPVVVIRAVGVKLRNRVFIDNRETDL